VVPNHATGAEAAGARTVEWDAFAHAISRHVQVNDGEADRECF
jgi:hypothetical protein